MYLPVWWLCGLGGEEVEEGPEGVGQCLGTALRHLIDRDTHIQHTQREEGRGVRQEIQGGSRQGEHGFTIASRETGPST